MARIVRFHGRDHHLPNDSMAADPLPGIWYVGERPEGIPASVPCFTERVFDRALAEHSGRTCGPDCEGDCFAEMYVAVANEPDRRSGRRKADAPLFTCESLSPETPPAPEASSAPAPTRPKPTRRAAPAANKE